MQDSIDRMFGLILADDRRRLEPREEEAAKALWRRVFKSTPEKHLEAAIQTWLEENSRGRPNVGKIKKIVEELFPSHGPEQKTSDDDDLAWAVAILEALAGRTDWALRLRRPEYAHTVQCAQGVLREHAFDHWEDAKSHLEPGWSPTTTETVL